MSPFDRFPTSPIAIYGPDGTLKSSSKGIFGDNGVTVFDINIDAEPGDYLERNLSNGKVETFTIRDMKFSEKFHAIPAHYRLLIDRKGAVPRPFGGTSVHFSGPNARLNLNSIDSSVNTVVEGPVLGELRSAIALGVADPAQKAVLLEAVEGLASATDKTEKIGAYQRLIASAADHMTVLAPFLPALGALLV